MGVGGFIGELRRKGLDVVLVIDGTGSMKLIIDDVKKAKMEQLVQLIDPTRANCANRNNRVRRQGREDGYPAADAVAAEAERLFERHRSGRAAANGEKTRSARSRPAINKMGLEAVCEEGRGAGRLVLVAARGLSAADWAMIRQFKSNNGTFNTVDVVAEEHERFEREFWLKVHREEPPKIPPLPASIGRPTRHIRSLRCRRWLDASRS